MPTKSWKVRGKGAIVREAASLASPMVKELAAGASVETDTSEVLDSGKEGTTSSRPARAG